MTIDMERTGGGASREQVSRLEASLGKKLPEDYRRFLIEVNGGVPQDNTFRIPGSGGDSGVNEFLGTSEVGRDVRFFSDRLPAHVIPIAFAACGDLVCLSLADGHVLFWDHESEEMRALANSFEQFFRELRPFDPTTVKLRPGQVQDVWVDPDLLK